MAAAETTGSASAEEKTAAEKGAAKEEAIVRSTVTHRPAISPGTTHALAFAIMDIWDCDGKTSIFLGKVDDMTWEEGATCKKFRGKIVRDGIRVTSNTRDFNLFLPVDKKLLERMEDVTRVRGRSTKNEDAESHSAVAKLELVDDEGRATLRIHSSTDPFMWFELDLAMEEEDYESEEDDEESGDEEEEVDDDDDDADNDADDEPDEPSRKRSAADAPAPLSKWLKKQAPSE